MTEMGPQHNRYYLQYNTLFTSITAQPTPETQPRSSNCRTRNNQQKHTPYHYMQQTATYNLHYNVDHLYVQQHGIATLMRSGTPSMKRLTVN